MTGKVLGVVVSGCLIAAAPVAAQTAAEAARAEADARQQRYQISTLERVLEGAVEHGVTVTRERLQAVAQMPAELLIGDNAHARGFRLDGYGVFFDVTVPSFGATLWTLQMLDQKDLGFDSAMKELQQVVRGNTNAEQALRRVELQVTPMQLARPSVVNSQGTADARSAAGSTASTSADTSDRLGSVAADPILSDPSAAYRIEVIQALKEAMLDHSSSLGIQAGEWLTIAARGNDDRPRLAPADSGSQTRILRLRGADLLAYLARTINKEEALKRIELRVF